MKLSIQTKQRLVRLQHVNHPQDESAALNMSRMPEERKALQSDAVGTGPPISEVETLATQLTESTPPERKPDKVDNRDTIP